MNDTVIVNLKGIDWDLYECFEYEEACREDSYWIEHKAEWCKEAGFPSEINGFVVGKSEDYDPNEEETEEDRQTGWEMFEEDLQEELSNEYGFCINGVESIEIINEPVTE